MRVLVVFVLFCVLLISTWATTDRVVCYFASWSVYRRGHGKYNVNDTDTSLCTHIIYAFIGISEDGSLKIPDYKARSTFDVIENLISLKDYNSKLKILVSMGGYSEGSVKFSRVAASPGKRTTLIGTVLDFIDEWGFDGFDIDWEYPCQRNGSSEDRENYVTLLAELKSALNAKGLILTAAVAGSPQSIDRSYDIANVVANLDMVNIMTYSYHGSFNPFVGHQSPLYASHLDVTKAQKQKNVDAGIRHWIEDGAEYQKINMGLNFYARTFTLSHPNHSMLYAPAVGGGDPGPYTRSRGVLSYYEICELHKTMPRYWDEEQKVPHKYERDQWYGYEDEKSVAIKVGYAKDIGLGGVMIWSLDADDFQNVCGEGTFPLLTAVNKALRRLV